MIDNNQKPLFEYSDLELKSIGFDMFELIENYKNNITLIRIEMSRRKTSSVLSTINQNNLTKIFSNNDMAEGVSFDNKEYSESYNPTTTKVSSQPQSNFKNLTDDTNSLITPLRKQ